MKKKSRADTTSKDHELKITILNKETNIQGDVYTDDNLRVSGFINGKCITKGKLIITEEAVVNGDISGSSVDIYGRVTGNVHSESGLYLSATSCLHGNCSCKKIKIEDGAYFQGSVNKNYQRVSSNSEKKHKEINDEIYFSDILKGTLSENRKGYTQNSQINENSMSDDDMDQLDNGRLW